MIATARLSICRSRPCARRSAPIPRTVSDRSGVVILPETPTLESSRSITRSIRRRSFFSKPGIGRARALFTEPSCVPFGDSSRIQQLHIFQKTLELNDFYFGMDGFEYPVGMPRLYF